MIKRNNKNKNKHKKLKLILLTFALTILVLNCQSISLSAQTIQLKIFSPYNCKYDITLTNNLLVIKSNSLDKEEDSLKNSTQIFAQQVDTVIPESLSIRIANIIDSLKSNVFIDSSKEVKDAYKFELRSDNILIRRAVSADKEIYFLIRLLMPYIEYKDIQCCEFFYLFLKMQN